MNGFMLARLIDNPAMITLNPALTLSPPRTRQRAIDSLTGARFVAAIMVVGYHYLQSESEPRWIGNVLSYGYLGVPFFLILSGFILTYNYVEPANQPGSSPRKSNERRFNARQFWALRFARIYPAYALAALVQLPFFVFGLRQSVTQVGGSPVRNFLLVSSTHLTLTQAFFVVRPFTALLNQPGWTVSVEAFFYLTFPLSARWMARLNHRNGVAVILCLLTCMAGIDHLLIPAVPKHGQVLGLHGILDWDRHPLRLWPLFLIGSALCPVFESVRKNPWCVRWAGAGCSITVAIFLLLTAFDLPIRAGNYSYTLLAGLMTILIFFLAFDRGVICRALALPSLVLLGEASYAIYILQEPIWIWVMRLSARFLHWHDVHAPSMFFTFLPLLLLLSIVVNRYFETPMRSLLRKRLAGTSRWRCASHRVMHTLDPCGSTKQLDNKNGGWQPATSARWIR